MQAKPTRYDKHVSDHVVIQLGACQLGETLGRVESELIFRADASKCVCTISPKTDKKLCSYLLPLKTNDDFEVGTSVGSIRRLLKACNWSKEKSWRLARDRDPEVRDACLRVMCHRSTNIFNWISWTRLVRYTG